MENVDEGGRPRDLCDSFDGMIELSDDEYRILEYSDDEYERYRELRERESRLAN